MDSEMLRQFYRCYASEIYLYLYSLCKNRELAENLMQEVFLKALLSLSDAHTNMRALHSFTEVNEILKSMEEQDISLSQIWVAVCGDETGNSTVGYDYDNQQGNIPVSLNKTYPELTLFEKDEYDDEDYENADKKSQDETVMTQHLVSIVSGLVWMHISQSLWILQYLRKHCVDSRLGGRLSRKNS